METETLADGFMDVGLAANPQTLLPARRGPRGLWWPASSAPRWCAGAPSNTP